MKENGEGFKIEIAGICTSLKCDDKNLSNLIKEEYKAFLSKKKQHVSVDIHLLPGLRFEVQNKRFQ